MIIKDDEIKLYNYDEYKIFNNINVSNQYYLKNLLSTQKSIKIFLQIIGYLLVTIIYLLLNY